MHASHTKCTYFCWKASTPSAKNTYMEVVVCFSKQAKGLPVEETTQHRLCYSRKRRKKLKKLKKLVILGQIRLVLGILSLSFYFIITKLNLSSFDKSLDTFTSLIFAFRALNTCRGFLQPLMEILIIEKLLHRGQHLFPGEFVRI